MIDFENAIATLSLAVDHDGLVCKGSVSGQKCSIEIIGVFAPLSDRTAEPPREMKIVSGASGAHWGGSCRLISQISVFPSGLARTPTSFFD